jgi:hypothetical protein
MFKIIRSKETNQITLVTGPKSKNGDNLNNIRREASRRFRNEKREYMKTELMSIQHTVRTRT